MITQIESSNSGQEKSAWRKFAAWLNEVGSRWTTTHWQKQMPK